MKSNLIDYLEQKLISEFIKNDEEWVDIYITPLNRIDITIVSNIADEMDKNELRGYIRNLVFEYLGADEASQYTIGFIDTYNIDEADDLLLQRPEARKKQPITWSDVVRLNSQVKSKISDRDYNVICFYSYKGGVGRTTALLQVAYALAQQGKNIVLIDFDIEAPSFHLLFKKWIDDPKSGIKHGLVDYLYERMAGVDPREYKIKITDIYTTINVNQILNGNIYVVPATVKLTNQYIFKLAQLRSNIIYENDYMDEFIEALSAKLKFDTVFIDTRTGLNQWGAFPVLGFADQIVLVAYPNEENIEGLKSIIELMQKAGLDNYIVAMSKFEEDDVGVSTAKQYFEKLKGIKQEFLGIGYISSSDMIGKYPFLDNLEPYKALSNYLMENYIVKFNIKFLSKVNVAEILKAIKKRLDTMNFVDSLNKEMCIGESVEEKSIEECIEASIDEGIKKEDVKKENLTEEDVKSLVIELLDISLFKEYIEAVLKNKHIFGHLLRPKEINNREASSNSKEEEESFKDNTLKHVMSQQILDLFWGIRVSPKRYCKTMTSWFYKELTGNITKGQPDNQTESEVGSQTGSQIGNQTSSKIGKQINYFSFRHMVIKILSKALEYEINKREGNFHPGIARICDVNMDTNVCDVIEETAEDRMLGVSSISMALSWFRESQLDN